ncbi:MAG: recombinase zinc beta ribbon domain-containing protein [Betaproteobacteria bacterium]|nr:recombinase zinc beta ribbon domain-containing protein [Betaproteobacteria bacterium]
MYVGRFRWQKQEFASPHPPIIAESTFAAAKQILDSRSEEPTGKRWHHQDERLLTGLIRCGRCRSGMVGVSGNKKGQKHSYYACTKRLESKECDQDYVRTDLIEPLILDEIQKVFRDEALLEEVWQSAQAQLAASAPQLEAEIKQMDRQRAKAQGALDRYFAAFEAGTMAPADCSLRVAELTAQMKQFDEQLASLREQRAALDLPAIRADFLNEILTNLSGVVGAIPAPQKKHLLRLLVEKVLVRDRCTFEVWYRLPQFPEVRTLGELVAPTGLEPVLPP